MKWQALSNYETINKIMTFPVIIGIAGGTGAGKSTMCRQIAGTIEEDIVIVSHDMYYKDLSHMPVSERDRQSFDHPSALDNKLFISHLTALKKGNPIDAPCYDFVSHIRTAEIRRIDPVKTILVEGLMLYTDKRIRDILDYKIYIDLGPDIRFIRRLKRDTEERGRNMNSVIEQYLATVKPMHDQYVEPSRKYADFVISGVDDKSGMNEIMVVIRMLEVQ